MVNFGSIRRVALLAGAVFLPSIIASPAAAVQMVVSYSGKVVDGFDDAALFGGGDLIEKAYLADYLYDTDDLELVWSASDAREYRTNQALFTLVIGSYSRTQSGTLSVLIVNDADQYNTDRVSHGFFSNSDNVDSNIVSKDIVDSLQPNQTFRFSLGDPVPGQQRQASTIYGTYVGDKQTSLQMSVTTIDQRPEQVTPLPEPASWALMLTGFATIAGALRVRQRRVAFA